MASLQCAFDSSPAAYTLTAAYSLRSRPGHPPQELAGIVKLLRRGMKELQSRTNDFIAAACKQEKEVAQQARGRQAASKLSASFCSCCY